MNLGPSPFDQNALSPAEVISFPVVPKPIPLATHEKTADALERYFTEFEFYPQKTAGLCGVHMLMWLRANGFKIVPLKANE